jgi:hypothetical protein
MKLLILKHKIKIMKRKEGEDHKIKVGFGIGLSLMKQEQYVKWKFFREKFVISIIKMAAQQEI